MHGANMKIFHLITSEITTQIAKTQEFCLWCWNHWPPII